MVERITSLVTGNAAPDVLDVIKKEHREATALLEAAIKLEPDDAKMAALASKIEATLTTHVEIEERLLYAKIRTRAEDQHQEVDIFEAYTEHEVANRLIAMLKSRRKRDARFKAELQVLAENIKHHVKEEESTVFSIAKELIDADERSKIGKQWLAARKRADETSTTRPPAAKTAAKNGATRRGGSSAPRARQGSRR